ncbi:MAG TPA: accessory gene regulator B family protein [Candidatus Pelethenecus sp.]|nr:accessory gene regulator B family protein [Candidatus Pelethenecus sp.]
MAKKITNYYIKKGSIQKEEQEVYEYCFDVMLSTLLNLVAIIIISVATKLFIEGAVFCIVFMTLRGIGGGYHANTHFFCFMTIMIVFTIYVLLLKLVSTTILLYLTLSMIASGFLIICIFAPVDTETKPLTNEERKKNKIKTILLLFLYTLATSLLLIFEITKYYAFNVAFPLFAVSILMIFGTIKNIKWKRKQN